MTTRLLDRISVLLRADAHGVMDALEERSLLLRQHLRDAELELLQKRARAAALEQEGHRLQVERDRRREQLERLDADVALALAEDDEELARFAIRRLLPLREELQALEARLTATVEARERLGATLIAQEEAFAELRSRARTRLAEVGSASPCDDPLGPPPVDEACVELELLRRRSGEAAR